ncbi:hypothetical protein BHE74_00004251 [Ensete ventricosum]|nr:hypothetical protein BHE74_00004251 [Ensete ventricosum]
MTEVEVGGRREEEKERYTWREGKKSPPLPPEEGVAAIVRGRPVSTTKEAYTAVAHDSRQIPLHRVPHGLRQRVGRRPERVRGDADPRAPSRRRGGCGYSRHDRGQGGGGRHLLVGRQGGGGMGDGDGDTRRAGGSSGEYGGGVDVSIDEVLDLVDVGLGGGVEGDGVAMRHLRRPPRRNRRITGGARREGRGFRSLEGGIDFAALFTHPSTRRSESSRRVGGVNEMKGAKDEELGTGRIQSVPITDLNRIASGPVRFILQRTNQTKGQDLYLCNQRFSTI